MSGSFLFVVDIIECSDYRSFGSSAVDVALEDSAWSEGVTSVFWARGSDWDIVSFTGCSIFTLSSSSVSKWLSLTRIVQLVLSGCVNDVSKPFLMMKVAGIAFLYSWALNRMGSNESNLLFYLPRAKLLSSLNPRQQLLRYCLVPNLNPVDRELSSNVGFWPHRVCFSHAKPVQLTFLAFVNKFFNVRGKTRLPCYHSD